jgi:outer membrane lipoprotein-sorting protein
MQVPYLTRAACVPRVALLAAVSLLTLRAQQVPDGAALLKRSADAFKNYNTYQYTEVTSGSFPGGMEMTMVNQATSSGKMRVEMKMGGMDGMLMISDGRNMWMYMAMLKRYTKLPMDPDAMGALAAGFGAGQPADVDPHAVGKVLRAETIQVDGEPHDCWVVESVTPDSATPGAYGAKLKDAVSTHWIDKTSGISFKTSTSSKVQLPGSAEPVAMTTTASRHGFRFNLPLDDSLFVFTPPAGAQETDELFPGMKGMFSKDTETVSNANAAPVAAPASAPAPAPLAAQPQAYVPNLMPIEQIEPPYPESARASNAHGMVELLVTIDPAGSVVKAEPLTGPELLRPAAINAVQQWRFHPVIRNNSPVYAYTDAIVDYAEYGKAGNAGDFQMDLSEQMAASQRRESLMEKFPRSPQQALADLEQDRGTGGEIEHLYALPQLAKAAFKADDLDKAALYAKEALHSASGSDAGDAVHDGNMVLGLISLRNGDVMEAKHYLSESAKTTGSPVLGSFGPNMLLAKGLLENGERDAVLEYLESCRAFWKMGEKQLDAWIATLRGGGMPSFAANLVY